MHTLRIHPEIPSPSDDQLARLRELPSTIVSDTLERHGFAQGLHQITRPELGILAGPALTVRTRPGDNLAIHKAITLARPGDVLVVDGEGFMGRALIGEIAALHAASRGIAGLVIDGCIRDGGAISARDLAVYARGYAHPAPFKDGPGELRGVVSVGGAVVANGDVVVADEDGVAVVPRGRIDETIDKGLALLAKEEPAIVEAREGRQDTSWLDAVDVEWVGGEPR